MTAFSSNVAAKGVGFTGTARAKRIFVGSSMQAAMLGFQVQYPESAGVLSLLREVSASGEAACF